MDGLPLGLYCPDWALPSGELSCCLLSAAGNQDFYFEKIRVFKAGLCSDTLAWNNKMGLQFFFVGSRAKVMINRDSWGHSYLAVRGEILRPFED